MAASKNIRIIPHEAVPQTGSFEVRFPDGRASVYFSSRIFLAGACGRRCSTALQQRPRRKH